MIVGILLVIIMALIIIWIIIKSRKECEKGFKKK